MTVADPLRSALKEHFGHGDFRGRQRAIIERVMRGEDTLVIMPTGDGKSLCYQLPALMLPGLTVVVSPLIALMKDQVDALQRRDLPATTINSSLDRKERERRLELVRQGDVKLLYVTPERFRSEAFDEIIRQQDIAFLAIDEAHCLSQWGHDFRPDYGQLGEIRRRLGSPPVLALTATATPEVQSDIRRILDMEDAELFHAGIERPGLFLAASEHDDEASKIDRVAMLLERLSGAGIVYGALIKDLLRLEEELKVRGFRPLVYHGKLGPEERRRMQDTFMAGDDTLVLATNAFGMGVDKPDIRFVLHYQMPGSVEAYTQEIGRAGRDGLPSYCELLYFQDDLAIQQEFRKWSNPDREFLLGVARLLERWKDHLLHHTEEDLVNELLMKNRRDNRVFICLRWLEVLGVIRGTFEGRDIELLRPLDESEIPDDFNEDKFKRDLQKLLDLVRYVKLDTSRKDFLRDYFGLEGEPATSGCDQTEDAEEWLERSFPSSRAVSRRKDGTPEPSPIERDADGIWTPQRGDWIKIKGRRLARVLKVSGEGRGARLEVEYQDSLERGNVTIGRVKIQPVR
ncbi:MAG: ATP-dependent DNA helicase RecQ [Planctomycetota bacterium]